MPQKTRHQTGFSSLVALELGLRQWAQKTRLIPQMWESALEQDAQSIQAQCGRVNRRLAKSAAKCIFDHCKILMRNRIDSGKGWEETSVTIGTAVDSGNLMADNGAS